MLDNISRLYEISKKDHRRIIGLMSGTSLDGLDIALCKITGSGLSTQLIVQAFTTVSYSENMVANIQKVFSKQQVHLEALAILNEEVGIFHGQAVREQLLKWNIDVKDIDLVASHGQTIFHAPASFHKQVNRPNASLQIGDGDHVARESGIITIADFRQRHLAAGGEGAPLVTYGDHLLFASKGKTRILINIGGIANLTFMPKTANLNQVISTDVGPGNTLMDAYVREHFSPMRYDKNSSFAKKGKVNTSMLNALLSHDFLHLHMPKTTGPEAFDLKFVDTCITAYVKDNVDLKSDIEKTGSYHFDVLATLNMFTAKCIAMHVLECLKNIDKNVDINDIEVYLSGGGVHNPLLLQNIASLLPNIQIQSTEALGVSPDAKEAALFALLANECIAQNTSHQNVSSSNTPNQNIVAQTNVPQTSMGKICFPV